MLDSKWGSRAAQAILGCALAVSLQVSFGVAAAAAADLNTPMAAPYAPAIDPYMPAITPFTQANHPFWTIDEVRVGALDHALEDSVRRKRRRPEPRSSRRPVPGGYGNSIVDFFLTPQAATSGLTLGFGKTDEFYWGVTWDAKLFGPTFLEVVVRRRGP